jgi:hypothetical protein
VKIKKDIDQLFKDGLSEPDIPFNELDWENMAAKLDQQVSRRRRKTWLLWSSAAAAVLLVALFSIFLTPDAKVEQHPEKNVVKTGERKGGQGASEKTMEGGYPEKEVRDEDRPSEGKSPLALSERVNRPALAGSIVRSGADEYSAGGLNPSGVGAIPLVPAQPANTRNDILPDLALMQPVAGQAPAGEKYAAVERSVKKKMKTDQARPQQVILSAIVAPDLSYAKSAVGSKVSSNFGLLATYEFHPRLSVTSGAVYANKYYNSSGDAAAGYGFDGHSLQINAVCNVIDIPVNVNYKLLNRKAFSLSLNTGLSSYIMLKEKYDYVYSEEGYAESTVSMEIKNQNRHMFGVANVSLSFDRKISPNLSIGVQPFMKLPLTGIGYGNADLRSTGVSFSLNMGLFPGKKPAKNTAWSHLRR